MKVALVASAGGHLSELLEIERAWRGHEVFFVTTGRMVAGELEKRFGAPVHVVVEANRTHPLRMVRMLAQCVRIVLRERPDVVVSSGAAPGCLMCAAAKLLRRAKVVWLDSIANVARPSLSGRIVRAFADLFLVQWPHLARTGRRGEYCGEVV